MAGAGEARLVIGSALRGVRARTTLSLWLLAAASAAGAGHAQSTVEWADGDVHLGLVRDGRFVPLEGRQAPMLLTTTGSRDGSPEAGKIDVSRWEGLLIAVTGEPGRGWMHSAEVRESAGFVVSGAIRELWGRPRETSRRLAPASGSTWNRHRPGRGAPLRSQ